MNLVDIAIEISMKGHSSVKGISWYTRTQNTKQQAALGFNIIVLHNIGDLLTRYLKIMGHSISSMISSSLL